MATNNAIDLKSTGVVTYDGAGTFSGSTVTQYAVVCGSTSNTLQNVSGVGSATQVLTSNGAGMLPTWQDAAGGGLTWNDQGSSTTATSNNGYFVTGNFAITLPASPSQGDEVIVIADTASVVTVTGNTGQVIRLGDTTTAAAGSVTSTARGDCIDLVYRTSGTTWIAKSSIGNWGF